MICKACAYAADVGVFKHVNPALRMTPAARREAEIAAHARCHAKGRDSTWCDCQCKPPLRLVRP